MKIPCYDVFKLLFLSCFYLCTNQNSKSKGARSGKATYKFHLRQAKNYLVDCFILDIQPTIKKDRVCREIEKKIIP